MVNKQRFCSFTWLSEACIDFCDKLADPRASMCKYKSKLVLLDTPWLTPD